MGRVVQDGEARPKTHGHGGARVPPSFFFLLTLFFFLSFSYGQRLLEEFNEVSNGKGD
jgi:hypothetical protein